MYWNALQFGKITAAHRLCTRLDQTHHAVDAIFDRAPYRLGGRALWAAVSMRSLGFVGLVFITPLLHVRVIKRQSFLCCGLSFSGRIYKGIR